MIKQTSLDELNVHLFETIEMLKNNNDQKASPNERIDIETAQTIASLGKVIVDGYKVKAQVLSVLSKEGYSVDLKSFTTNAGLQLPEKTT